MAAKKPKSSRMVCDTYLATPAMLLEVRRAAKTLKLSKCAFIRTALTNQLDSFNAGRRIMKAVKEQVR
jgi:hypothetical protein